MKYCQTKILKLMMSVVLQNLYCNVDYFEIITIFDALDLEMSVKFCTEDMI